MLALNYVYENPQSMMQEPHRDQQQEQLLDNLRSRNEPVGVHNPLLYTLSAKRVKAVWVGAVIPNRQAPPQVITSMFEDSDT